MQSRFDILVDELRERCDAILRFDTQVEVFAAYRTIPNILFFAVIFRK